MWPEKVVMPGFILDALSSAALMLQKITERLFRCLFQGFLMGVLR
jgi:hypothetical protein